MANSKKGKGAKNFKNSAGAEAVAKTNPTAQLLSGASREAIEKIDEKILPKKSTLTAADKKKMETDFDPPTGNPPEGYKRNPEYIQVKSRRVQLVLQPTVYEALERAAVEAGISRNEYIHRLLKKELNLEA